MRYRSLLAGAAALALALSLTACGDDDGDDASSSTTEESAETTESTESTEESTETTESDETTTEPEEGGGDLTPALVTAADVGPTFTEGEYEASSEPGPCGGDIDTDRPFEEIVGTVLVDEEAQLALQHELRTYADADTATDTYAFAQDALSCGADTTDPGIVLGEVLDVSTDVGADAFAVELTSAEDGLEGALVVVLVDDVLSVYQFQGPADVEDGPDAVAIVAANVEVLKEQLAG